MTTKIEASSPSINSSINIRFPASPNFFSIIILLIASLASSTELQIITPFPAARPLAFITQGTVSSLTKSNASADLSKERYSAVGMEYFCISSFANNLLPSSAEALAVGPNISDPFALNSSTIPFTRGCSGPTIVRSISLDKANFRSSALSLRSKSTKIASFIPGFPGAQYRLFTRLSLDNFQTNACSLPPEPNTSRFMLPHPPLFLSS